MGVNRRERALCAVVTQPVLLAPSPLTSELSGLPFRRHFPWNLILLTIFVSYVGVSGDRC